MYIAYHDQNNQLHIANNNDDQYLGSWGTLHQCSLYVKDSQVIEEYSDWTPEEPGDDTWTTDRQVLGIADFTGSNLEELILQHKQWFKTFMEQTNE